MPQVEGWARPVDSSSVPMNASPLSGRMLSLKKI
jgi:hypothetical protein